ncbi:MAG: 2-phospho-L-lactate transferase [Holophagales bacterium]|nr:2-phospho-L-lactate transferase [Holophagales bacterium]MYC11252.1 2-phospho-L-lactate transferase [Holophagales bacterium]
MTEDSPRHCVALSGGVGGAKLALGLSRVLPGDSLTVVCNTADDFDHLGLRVCPDLDTVMYTLGGISNRDTGWGQAHETWSFLEALSHLGGETWFRLGDRDLATHVERTRRLRAGETLTEVTAALCGALGIAARVLPMSDDPLHTVVLTETGELSFQHYFVRDACAPTVSGFRFEGIATARPSPAFLAALEDHTTAAILVCPSNPFVSVDPVLALDGVEAALRRTKAPVVAVSPIVGGAAIKGPAAKMMAELGMPVTAVGVARHYRERDLLDGFVIDDADTGQAAEIEDLGLPTLVTGTVMKTLADRERLARETFDFACGLDPRRGDMAEAAPPERSA